MCGISGFVGNLDISRAKQRVQSMNDALSHRGPDGSGSTTSGNVILAMRRLAIIDVEGGKQPLFTEDKSVAIVGNGELYNYIELQKELRKKGHKLATGSDIEVFAHLYEDYGWEAVHKVRGMFALALHDRKKKKVYLFRDRLGEKPLYYTKIGKNIYFASEFKALLVLPIQKKINHQALDDYFHLYYVPEPNTPLHSVHKLPAGSILEIDCKTLEVQEHTYWSLSNFKSKLNKNPTSQIKKTFDESCNITLRSDVPVVISLSSGIDSSAIAILAAKHSRDNLTALTVGYPNAKRVDERESALELSKTLKMKHILSELQDETIIADFPKLVWDCDDLIAEIGMFNINEIYKTAHENKLKVLLAGVGGDELFWGYPWMRVAANLTLKKRSYGKQQTISFLKSLIPKNLQKEKPYVSGLEWLNNLLSPAEQIVMNDLRPPFKGGERVLKHLYHPEFSKQVDISKRFGFLQFGETDDPYAILHRMMELLIQRWLTSQVITINDRLAMANGVEVRLPFLDCKLVEEVFSHLQTVIAYDKPGKQFFRKAMKGVVSEELMNRPKKGFTPPVARWLWQLITQYYYLLKDGFVVQEKIINPKLLPTLPLLMLYPHNWYPIFQIIVLEVWGREFVWGQKPGEIKPKGV